MSQPNYSSVEGYTGEQFFTLHFDAPLDGANPPQLSAFRNVAVSGSPVTVSGVEVDGAAQTVTLFFTGAVLNDNDYVEFSYADPTAGNDVRAIQGTDGADANSINGGNFTVLGARLGPSMPSTPALSGGSDSGTPGDRITNDNTPTLTGVADACNTVKLYDSDGTTLLGTTTADGAGNWSITASRLSDAVHTLRVTQTAGQTTSPKSIGLALTIDTAVAAPTSVALSHASDSGTLGDGISNAGMPVFTGHSEANATVRLYDTGGSTLRGTAFADSFGNWSLVSNPLTSGAHTLTFKQSDVAGNVSAASSSFTYFLDTMGPRDLALSATRVAQSTAVTGATVATLLASDEHTITYSFASVSGAGGDNGKFTIVGNALVAAQDLVANTSYSLYVQATDVADNSTFQIFSIDVVDAPVALSIVRAAAASTTVAAAATSVVYTVTFS
ncbi:Ig-like domain-containing protein [Rugamonas aquatica]|uniref:Bacterial Ig-like domain-containing protein n=1 Tax=Rugamonas aquatica TaxID=2743357 RepID=A0A6A7N6B9_9BURK|nr:Ig-like domain-containing protein [Rugamonas aquatica]MQA40432.1 hypothetical protein [Rugamonas aquatica]